MRRLVERAAAILVAALIFSATILSPVTAGAAEGLRVQKLQKELLAWENAQYSGKTLLSGNILKRGGESASDWIAFGYVRSGNTAGAAEYLAVLRERVESIYRSIEKGDTRGIHVEDLCRLSLVIGALGEDPSSLGKKQDGSPIDLINDSAFNCILGDVGQDGLEGVIWALLVVDSKPYPIPEHSKETPESLAKRILEAQNEDGGFGKTVGARSDVEITAMALTALGSYSGWKEVESAAKKAFAWLAEKQLDNAVLDNNGERTSECISWTLIALTSWGLRPSENLVKNGITLLDALDNFRLEDGSMLHCLGEEEIVGDIHASYLAVGALEAVNRLQAGENRLFDLMDAPSITAAPTGKVLDSEKMLIGIASVVIIVMILVYLVSIFSKKRSSGR